MFEEFLVTMVEDGADCNYLIVHRDDIQTRYHNVYPSKILDFKRIC